MAYNGNITKHARQYTSATDVTAELKTFFQRAAGDTVVQAGAGGAAVGVLWYAQATTDAAVSVVCGGEPDVVAGAAIAVGDEIASDANGEAVVAVSTNVVLGYARHAAATGELVRIDFLGEDQFVKA
jgi:shikimate 5-dehydrogenase